MTTARRLRRDRKRYNAIRRIRRALTRQIVRYAFFDGNATGALESYNDLRWALDKSRDAVLLRFRSWARCHCGRLRQTIRLA